MFPGFRDRKKKLLEKSRARGREMVEKIKSNPEALASVNRAVLMQLLASLGLKAYEWVSENPGRKFVVEHEPDGISIEFTENGEEAIPDFMKKGG
jgi:hypothetical protein